MLGGVADEQAQQHLRTLYAQEPEYRDPVAMSLAQHPGGDNWPYLVDALKTASGPMAEDILAALATVAQRPSEAAPYRHAILAGLRLGDNGGDAAARLLAHWNGDPPASSGAADWRADLARWQQWYAKKFPAAPPADLPQDAGRDKWSYDELLKYLDSDAGKQGDAQRGQQVFTAAQCASCHRVGNHGETFGPDLTTVAQRFQRKEILESIVFPSHNISDQYASRIVVAGGKSYAGLIVERSAQGVVVLLPTGKKVTLGHEQIDDIQPSTISSMPTGLLNSLPLDRGAVLFPPRGAAPPGPVAARPAPAR
ncbi:MAG TPA: c-type cytochrome [Lacipirellulaceae bacterium]|nr:c-type cytochrome [Lacipirellulaceae bacterium]